MTLTEEVASVESLTLTFDKIDAPALADVSFCLNEGESLALIGESGSGKTSLLRLLLGLLRPTRGKVRLFGQPLDDVDGEELRRIRRKCSYIPQDPFGGLPPTLSPLQAVVEPLIVTRPNLKYEGTNKAKELLSDLGIEEALWNRKLVQGFSGGQRQRIMLARALITDPKLLLADEPTSMQDVSTRMDLINLLKVYLKNGMSMIFVTHDLLLAKAMTLRGIVLYRGRMCETGPTHLLLRDPLHPYTKALVSALPKLGKPIEVKVKRRPLPVGFKGCPYLALCPYGFDRCKDLPPMKQLSDARSVACFMGDTSQET